MDPRAMSTRQIGIDEVQQALSDGNVNLPTGALWGPQRTATVEASGQLFSAADYEKLVVPIATALLCGFPSSVA